MKREELLEWLDSLIINSAELGESDDAKSWGYEEGILISRNEAEEIRTHLSLPPAEGAEEILERVMFENGFTYVSFPAFVENESSVDVFDVACKAMTDFATLHAQQMAEKMVEKMSPSNKQIHEAALAWARDHSEAPDKDCPDWLIRDYEAGAYFVRQCIGCWNKTDEMHDNRLLRFIKWLRYRNFTDDTTTDEGWLSLYHNDPDIPE